MRWRWAAEGGGVHSGAAGDEPILPRRISRGADLHEECGGSWRGERLEVSVDVEAAVGGGGRLGKKENATCSFKESKGKRVRMVLPRVVHTMG